MSNQSNSILDEEKETRKACILYLDSATSSKGIERQAGCLCGAGGGGGARSPGQESLMTRLTPDMCQWRLAGWQPTPLCSM